MCNGRGIDLLPSGIIFVGVIIREYNGHRFYINNDFDQLKECGRRLKKINPNGIFKPISYFRGDKEKLRTKIKKLNKKAGLPGVGFCLNAA